MNALILDFDGVISNSARECFTVSVATYRETSPARNIPKSMTQEDPEVFRYFCELMPLGNRAEDFGAALLAFETNQSLPDQDAYDAFVAQIDPTWLQRFRTHFYAMRERMLREDFEGWLELSSPYPEIVASLTHSRKNLALGIATAKNRKAVRILLEHYGLASVFREDWICDMEAGVSKRAHLEILCRQMEIDYGQMTFLDDKVNHLEAVTSLGVRCALATWGFNGPREVARAKALGFGVWTMQDFNTSVGAA